MLSQTAEYALRAAVFIAQQPPGELVGAAPMAATLGIPQNYLAKTLHQLARVGVLRSTRGKSGGFTLGRDPFAISLADVISPFDTMDERPQCLLGRPECSSKNPCPAHGRWQGVARQITEFFQSTSLGDVAKGPPSTAWTRPFLPATVATAVTGTRARTAGSPRPAARRPATKGR